MKKNKQSKLHRSTPFLLVLAAIVFFIAASVAIYTNQSYKKGVAITTDSDAMFSSDKLIQMAMGTTDYPSKDASVTAAGDTNVSYTVEVYNYAPGMATRINPNDITYNFTVTAIDTEYFTSDGHTFNVSDGSNHTSRGGSCTISNKFLNHGSISINTFTITFPKDVFDNGGVRFQITAEPVTASINAVNNKKLAVIVVPVTTSSETASINKWSGHWVEQVLSTTEQTDLKPSDCAAFNFEFSGTGTGTVTLTWPAGLKIDEYFLKEVTATESGNSIWFKVDSSTRSSYNVRFYRTGTSLGNLETDFSYWNSADNFSFK